MPNCTFLTIANQDGWFIDDDLVHAPLRRLGWEIDDVPWDANVDWNAYDVVVIRSPWDYQSDLENFFSVLQRIEDSSATLYNSLATVKWNINKNYLFELQGEGIEIVPTLCMETPSLGDVHEVFEHFATDRIVLKPVISANADDTFLVSRETERARLLEICTIFSTKKCLAQPFMHGITSEGEFSLVYIDGRLSHSIIKTVGKDKFRVQEEHGGGVIPLRDPESGLVVAADKTISVLSETPLYARVDLVRTEHNSFALMELELIEPCLYFRFGEHSAMDFAKVIDSRYRCK